MKELEVFILKALKDNYIYIICDENDNCICVDVSDAKLVLDFLDENDLNLQAIFITHHHSDHTQGLQEVVAKTNAKVFNFENTINANTIEMLDSIWQIIHTKGHTNDSICFYNQENALLFSGDTLFSGGIGRNFEGEMIEFYHSIQKLKKLPDATKIYFGHEYTKNNLRFAIEIEPKNQALKNYRQIVAQTESTSPSSIAIEKMTNVFFRTQEAEIIEFAKTKNANSDEEIFTLLRKLKDDFL